MVNFKPVPLSDPRLTPEMKAKFLHVGQLIEWTLSDSSGSYSGLFVVGEKPHPQGFQSVADITIDIGEKEIPITKVQELARIVQTEFVQRAVISTVTPKKA